MEEATKQEGEFSLKGSSILAEVIVIESNFGLLKTVALPYFWVK